jgi:DNA-binding response OmpR family regulator
VTGYKDVKILIVDNERLIADTLAAILRMNGFEPTVAYSAEDALLIAKELHPDLLLSDVIMGPMSGIDLAIVLSAVLPNGKILLSSGQSATMRLLDAAESRGHHFEILAKPVHPQLILDRISAYD